MVLDPPECSDCKRLRDDLLTATTYHFYVLGKLRIAQLTRDMDGVRSLQQAASEAIQRREEARTRLKTHQTETHG